MYRSAALASLPLDMSKSSSPTYYMMSKLLCRCVILLWKSVEGAFTMNQDLITPHCESSLAALPAAVAVKSAYESKQNAKASSCSLVFGFLLTSKGCRVVCVHSHKEIIPDSRDRRESAERRAGLSRMSTLLKSLREN
jgi:hypothetical protein